MRLLVAVILFASAACSDQPRSLAFATASVVVDAEDGRPLPAVTAMGEKGPVPLELPVTYVIEPATIAEIVNGRIVPTRNGAGKITARVADPAVAAATIDVVVRLVDRVRASCPTTPCVARVGESVTLAVEVLGLGTAVDVPVTWTVDRPEIATIADGTLTAIAPGVVVARASSGAVSGDVRVEVRAPVDAVRLFCPDPFLAATTERNTPAVPPTKACLIDNGGAVRLTVEVLAGGKETTVEAIEWSVSDTRVGLVAGGEVRGVGVGLALVRATAGGVAAEMPIEVRAGAGRPTGRGCSELAANYKYAVPFTWSSSLTANGETRSGGTRTYQCESREAQTCLESSVGGTGWISDGALAAAARHCCCRG